MTKAKDGIGVLRLGPGDERGRLDLRAEIDGAEERISLQSVIAGKSFHVHDRVDAGGVRIGPDAGSHHDDAATDVALDHLVQLVETVLAVHHRGHFDGRIIELHMGAAIDDAEAVILARLLHAGDEHMAETELLGHRRRRFLRLLAGGHGQDEGELDDAVVLAVAVGADGLLHALPSRISRKGLK